MIGILSIVYDEFSQESYQSVLALLEGGVRRSFLTGDVTQDFRDGWNWLNDEGCQEIMVSSSVDHFLMDGEAYRWDDDRLIVRNEGVTE